MPLSFATWMALLNNFVIQKANFHGPQIGILQGVREIPGLLSFTLVFMLLFFSQQRFVYISIILLGLGTFLTGYFPTDIGLYATTVVMSIGFHYMQTLSQSLSLQWVPKSDAPVVLGRLSSTQAFAGLAVYIFIYFVMGYLHLEFKTVYALFGGITILLGVLAWIGFDNFKEDVIQEKKLKIKGKYWLFYLLTFFGGARRQIFVVFAGFLLVEKFGISVHHMVILLFVNGVLNIYLAPKVGRLISRFGEATILKLEYTGLIIIFTSYAFVDKLSVVYLLYLLDNLLFAMSFGLKTYFQKIADPKDVSASSAVSATINHIAAVFLPIVLGFVWLKSPSLVFLIGTCVAVLSLASAFLIPRHPREGFETRLSRVLA